VKGARGPRANLRVLQRTSATKPANGRGSRSTFRGAPKPSSHTACALVQREALRWSDELTWRT
jgi:hypothetical protein